MSTSATLTHRRIRRPLRKPRSKFRAVASETSPSTATTVLEEFWRYAQRSKTETRPTTVKVRLGPGKVRFDEEYERLADQIRLDDRNRNLMRRFWKSTGEAGADWIAERIATEHDLNVLDGVANVLADIGSQSIGPILARLESSAPLIDQASTLLKAIGWIPLTRRRRSADRLKRLLPVFFGHHDPELREAAAMATRCLRRRTALELLNGALAHETVESVRQLVEGEISERS